MDSKKRKEPSANTATAAASATVGSGGGGSDAEEKRPRRKKRMEMTREERKAEDKLALTAKRTRDFVAYLLQKKIQPVWQTSGAVHAVNINAAMTFDLKSEGLGDQMNVMHVIAETSRTTGGMTLSGPSRTELVKNITGAWKCGGKAVINQPDSRGLRPIDIDSHILFLVFVMECDLGCEQSVVDWSVNTSTSQFPLLDLVEFTRIYSDEIFQTIISRLSPQSWDVIRLKTPHTDTEDANDRGKTLLRSAVIGMTMVNICRFNTPESKKMLVERSTDRALEHFRIHDDFKRYPVWNEMLALVTAEEAVRLERVGAALDEWNRSVIDFYLLSPLISIVKGYL